MNATADLITTPELSAMLGLHPFRMGPLFRGACVGYAKGTKSHGGKIYSLATAAALISTRSGFTVKPCHLFELLTRREACALLNELGPARQLRSWQNWAAAGTGPRVLRLSGKAMGHTRYIRSDVVLWSEYLSHRRNACFAWGTTPPDAEHTEHDTPNGPNAAPPQPSGSGGGWFPFSLSEGAG